MSAPDRYFDPALNAWVTVCPPGEALGARDLENWSKRRAKGASGSDGRGERIAEDAFRAGYVAKRRRKGSKRRKAD